MRRCQFCGAWNAEDEHHCGLCGREPSGETPARAPRAAASALPARAAQPPPPPSGPRPPERRRQPAAPRRTPPRGQVIPFESIAPDRVPAAEPQSERRPRGPRPSARSAVSRPQVPSRQAALAFDSQSAVPVLAAFREAPVAPLKVRFQAAVLDAVLVLLGFACVVATFHVAGGRVQATPRAALPWGGVILALVLFYHVLWCVLRTDSAGMRFFRLRLINFDGHEAEPAQRTVRLVTACLSVAAGGLGLLWALFDEEKLTWHDHISKTFPTVDANPRVRQRRG